MKKALALVLAMLLVIGIALPACAATAKLRSTQAFLKALDEQEITYTILYSDNDNDCITVDNIDDNGFAYTIRVFFDSYEENCSIRVWDIMKSLDADFAKVLRTCNSLNSKYKYLKFYADESDNTAVAAMDLSYRTDGALVNLSSRDNKIGDILMEAIYNTVQILEIGYPDLSLYDHQ